MDSAVVLLFGLLTATLASLIAPWLLGRQTARALLTAKAQEAELAAEAKREDAELRARERREDWARQDAVAAAAEAQAEKVAAALAKAEANAQRERKGLSNAVQQVHVLVNDNLTSAKGRELKALRATLALLHAEQARSGNDPAVADAIASTAAEVTALELELAARDIAKEAAEAERARGRESAEASRERGARQGRHRAG